MEAVESLNIDATFILTRSVLSFNKKLGRIRSARHRKGKISSDWLRDY